MADVKSFSIDRAKWGKGRLHNEDGSMCCLGFLGRACGVTPKEMGCSGYPFSVKGSAKAKFPEWVRSDVTSIGSNDVERLVAFNDSSAARHSGSRRCKADVEKYIAKTFAKHGITVTFRGKAKKAVKS